MEKPCTWVALVVVFLLCACSKPPAPAEVRAPDYWPTEGWRAAVPETQGMDSGKLADMFDAIRQKKIPIHSLQVVRNGYLVVDAYFYPYSSDDLHDLASVTKSVTATLVGMAIDQRFVASPKEPLVSLFKTRNVANNDARKQAITLESLLTMQPGLDCDQTGGERTLREMRQNADWVQFTLDRPMAAQPGEKFVYCSPAMHVLSAVISQAAGKSAFEFAKTALFEPLGIRRAEWPADNQGNNFGWGDLHLHPRDMTKLGLLYLHNGMWDGRQIVSREWVHAATQIHAKGMFQTPYGYGWWVFDGKRAGQYEAVGRGGQRITVIPQENLIVVMTGGGFEPGDVGDLLGPALKPNQPLPENASASARLTAAIMAAAQHPRAEAASPLPEIARRVSGKSYRLAANELGLQTLALAFPSQGEGKLEVTFTDGRSQTGAIGFDGVPRIAAGGRFGLPIALSGTWLSPTVLQLNYDETGNINMFQLKLTFKDDGLFVDVTERTDPSVKLHFEGK